MSIRRAALAGTVVAVAALAPVGAATAAPGSGAVRRCVQDNLPRYSSPDRALVSQYFDLAQACRAALAGDGGSQIWLTPLGGGKPAAQPTADRNPSPAPGGTSTPATPAAPAGPARPKPVHKPAAARPKPTASATVAKALADADHGAGGPAAGLDPLAAPGWLLALIGAAGAAVAAAAGRRAWRRSR